ncbi:MAG TPA: hypothetical protein VMA37_06370 [Acetobacteraceae bacterium]|nr:hypothetical protein [Acetobacteraceae bacterium]
MRFIRWSAVAILLPLLLAGCFSFSSSDPPPPRSNTTVVVPPPSQPAQ